jgi:Protein of unknown function (DUF3156)
VVRFEGPAHRRAVLALDAVLEQFGRAGWRSERLGPLRARVVATAGERPLRLEVAREGKVFGGNYALEISTDEPVLPPTRGLTIRAKGIAQMRGLRLGAQRGDGAGRELAERLGTDARLAELLGRVHFERVRIEPDGRPVIRHLGGSVVWILFPPLVRQIPFVPDQVAATVAALDAFAAAGGR